PASGLAANAMPGHPVGHTGHPNPQDTFRGPGKMFWAKEMAKMAPLKDPREAQRSVITWQQIKDHQSQETGYWTVVKDRVYDVSLYVAMHPGGSQCITKFCLGDISRPAAGVHGYLNLHLIMEKLWIGMIERRAPQ
ncbi:hypothetical protein KIPB_012176, partial [Kipferlia bialata]